MARTKTWYLEQNGAGIIYWSNRNLTATETSTTDGWTVGKIAANNYSNFVQTAKNATGTFSTTVAPAATAPAGDGTAVNGPYDTNSISTDSPYNVVIPAGNWTFTFRVRAVTSGDNQDGRINIRVFAAPESTATTWGTVRQLTSAILNGTTVTNLTTTTIQSSTVTWSAPEVTLNNEHLIVRVAWQITGAGTTNTRDVVLFYGGTTGVITTPSFRERSYNIN